MDGEDAGGDGCGDLEKELAEQLEGQRAALAEIEEALAQDEASTELAEVLPHVILSACMHAWSQYACCWGSMGGSGEPVSPTWGGGSRMCMHACR
jgi:hypothetical protein